MELNDNKNSIGIYTYKKLICMIEKVTKDFSLSEKSTKITLSLILLLSLILRIYKLDAEDLWVDEIFSINLANNNIYGIITGSLKDTNPPLYYIILHYWSSLFGNGEFISRVPSVIFGIISIYVIYKTGRLIFNKEIGLISAFILSVSLFHIRYSQEVRSYSLLVLFVLLSNYYYFHILKDNKIINKQMEKSKKWVIIDSNNIVYIISTVVVLYIHFYGLFYVIFQNIYHLLVYRKYIKNWIILQGSILLLFIPWLPFVLSQTTRIVDKGMPIIGNPTLEKFYRTMVVFSGNDSVLYIFLLIGIYGTIHALRLYFLNKNKKEGKREIKISEYIFLLGWLLIPIIISIVISYFITPIYVDRYVIASLPALILIFSVLINNFRKTIIVLVVLILFIIPTISDATRYYDKPQKEEWRKAVNYIEEYKKDGDFIIIFPEFRGLPFAYYYETSGSNDDFKATNNVTEIENIVKGHKRVWYVTTIIRRDLKKDAMDIEKIFSNNFIRSKTIKFSNIKIYLYTKNLYKTK